MPEIDYKQAFSYGNSEQRLPSTFIPSGAQVIWQWNETNVAQFGSTYIMNSTRAAALNVTAFAVSTPGAAGGVGPRLRITWTMTSVTGGCMVLPIYDQTGSYLAVPNRFRIRYRIAMANNMKVGFCLHNGNAGTPYAYGVAQLPASNSAEANSADPSVVGGETPWVSAGGTGGVARSPNNSAGNPAVGTYYEDFVQYDLATASTRPIPMWGHNPVYGQGTSVTGANVATPADLLGAAPAAGWTGRSDVQYLGILFITNRPTGTSATVELADMQVINSNMSSGGYP